MIGGNTTDGYAVKKIIVFGCPETLGNTILYIACLGYAARVFSVTVV